MALISVSNNALSNISALPASIPTGALTLIKSITASASASIEFINGTNGVVLDGTYSSYVFSFVNIHPSINGADFSFNGSVDNGLNYNVTKTTTFFRAYHSVDDVSGLAYNTSFDLAQSTSNQPIEEGSRNTNEANCSGTLQIFNPSSNTFVKHFIARLNSLNPGDNGYSVDQYTGGYFNNTNPINSVKFVMSSGNIDDGTIKLYGVK